DKAAQAQLPGLMSSMKSTGTNKLYVVSRYYGGLAQKSEDLVSRFLTGKYADNTRGKLFDMLGELQDKVYDPKISSLERQGKERAETMGLDSKYISVIGDWNRKGAEKPAAAPPTAPKNTPAFQPEPSAARTSKPVMVKDGIEYYSLGKDPQTGQERFGSRAVQK
ncbi:MAG: hypothetical protein K2W88_01590, partial [Pararheinheimera sp.]|nr:hypothetical protein [Rheinheimera sp.]